MACSHARPSACLPVPFGPFWSVTSAGEPSMYCCCCVSRVGWSVQCACLSISNAIELILLQFDSIFRLCFVLVVGFICYLFSFSVSFLFSLSLSPCLTMFAPAYVQSILRFVYSLPSLCAEFVASSLSLLYPFRIYYLSSIDSFAYCRHRFGRQPHSPIYTYTYIFAFRYCRKQCRLQWKIYTHTQIRLIIIYINDKCQWRVRTSSSAALAAAPPPRRRWRQRHQFRFVTSSRTRSYKHLLMVIVARVHAKWAYIRSWSGCTGAW